MKKSATKDKVLKHTCENCLFDEGVKCFLFNIVYNQQPKDTVNQCGEFQQ